MKLSDYFLITFLITGFLASLAIGFSWYFAKHFCTPQRRLPKKSPADFGLGFEDITFSSQGVILNGWFIPGSNNQTLPATIIIAHGWSTNAAQGLPIARFLQHAGYHVLLYSARSHGASENDNPITLQKFGEDLIAAIDYVERRADVDITRLGVFGHSMGGSGAIVATSMEPRIRALVSSAAFADPIALTKEFMKKYHIPRGPIFHLVCFFINRWLGTSMSEIAPKNRIKRIRVPMLLIHGDADQMISPTNMDVLFSQAQQEYVQTLRIPGLGHSNIIQNQQYASRIEEFFDNHLRFEDQPIDGVPILPHVQELVK